MKRRSGDWNPDVSAAENARRELPLFVRDYFAAGRKMARKRVSAADMHQFRLLTKHFRYSLELFRPLYGPLMDQHLKRLKNVQTVLGELNDYSSTRQLMESSPLAAHPDVIRLFGFLDACTQKKRREFRKLWLEQFDATGEEARWTNYLARYAGAGQGRRRRSIIDKPVIVGG